MRRGESGSAFLSKAAKVTKSEGLNLKKEFSCAGGGGGGGSFLTALGISGNYVGKRRRRRRPINDFNNPLRSSAARV